MLCEACISVSNEALRKWHLKVLYNITHVQNDPCHKISIVSKGALIDIQSIFLEELSHLSKGSQCG